MLIDDVFAYGNDDDDDDNHGKSDDNTNNTYKFRVSVIVKTVMICHGDDEGDEYSKWELWQSCCWFEA